MKRSRMYPLDFESLPGQEAHVLASLCGFGESSDIGVADKVFESLSRKGLVAGYGYGVWIPTQLGRTIVQQAKAHHGTGNWPDFLRFMSGGLQSGGLQRGHDAKGSEGHTPARDLDEWQDRIQTNRLRNFMSILNELGDRDLQLLFQKPGFLSLPREAVINALAGGGLSDAQAREIEWAANRPRGWLDGDHVLAPWMARDE